MQGGQCTLSHRAGQNTESLTGSACFQHRVLTCLVPLITDQPGAQSAALSPGRPISGVVALPLIAFGLTRSSHTCFLEIDTGKEALLIH